VLDVETARFTIRPQQADLDTDWPDESDGVDQPEPVIEVPAALSEPGPPSGGRLKRLARKKHEPDHATDIATWELIEAIRQTRAELAQQERLRYPDPAGLLTRAANRSPSIGARTPTHPLFARIGVMVADQPWLPNFDDINAIPESVGYQIQPLLSLPSVPVAADLLVGPLGIVGTRAATMAAARHIMVSLYGLSTQDLHLHIATDDSRADAWRWAQAICANRPLDLDDGFAVAIVDGMENFGAEGFGHQEALDRALGVVILVDTVEELPSYCGTVLQIDPGGTAVLTNHLGNVVKGTPVGIGTAMATRIADDLMDVLAY
jgi:hypothetical protein